MEYIYNTRERKYSSGQFGKIYGWGLIMRSRTVKQGVGSNSVTEESTIAKKESVITGIHSTNRINSLTSAIGFIHRKRGTSYHVPLTRCIMNPLILVFCLAA